MRGTTTLYQKLFFYYNYSSEEEKVGKKCPIKPPLLLYLCVVFYSFPLYVSFFFLGCGSKLPQGLSFKLLHLLLQGVVVLLPIF